MWVLPVERVSGIRGTHGALERMTLKDRGVSD
jgi:hypothetical protein